MAANGLINGNIEDRVGAAMDNSNPLYQSAVNDAQNGRMDSIMEMAMPPIAVVGGGGRQQFDEGVDQIAEAFKTYLTQNQHIERDAPNVDTFDAFKAGVEFGSGPLFTPTPPPVAEEFGTPYVAPNVDEFEGIATEGTPGFVNPDYRQQPPSSFSLDPNDPRNAYLNQGGMTEAEDFQIDMTEFGIPKGTRPSG